MNRFPLLFIVVAFGFIVLFFSSLEWKMKQGELLRDIALLGSGTSLLIYSIREKVNTTYDYGQRIRLIILGVLGIMLGLAGILSYVSSK